MSVTNPREGSASKKARAGTQAAISASTKIVALLGHPVRHSRSPAMHNAAFASQGIDAVYLAFDVLPDHLGEAIGAVRALGMLGANITVPHKEVVARMVDSLDPVAARVGAVNTIVTSGKSLIGHNTDVDGFVRGLEAEWGRGPRGMSCLVLGAGGGARAVVAGLVREGAARVFINNRTMERAEALCREASSWGDVPCRAVCAGDLAGVARGVHLIVNATSVGLGETVKQSPLPVDIVTGSHVVMDLVYGDRPTALVTRARSQGALAFDGTGMLVYQAACSYRLWTGLDPPVDLMRRQV